MVSALLAEAVGQVTGKDVERAGQVDPRFDLPVSCELG